MLIAATTTATTTAGHTSGASYIFPVLLLALGAMWLIFIRPQRQKQKLQRSMHSDLAIGDEVLTAGGVFGTVTRLDEDEVGVEIAPNVEVRLARRAIAVHITEPPAADTATDPDTDSDPAADAPDSGEDAPG